MPLGQFPVPRTGTVLWYNGEEWERGVVMAFTFYWYPGCGTCRKAKKWLDEHGIEYEPIHIVEHPPGREELENMYRKSGLPLKKWFNTSGMRYRQLRLKERIERASEDEMLDWLASDSMLLKRPILTDGERVTVGFHEEEYRKIWGTGTEMS